mmetsp:Transcript_34665/g.80911  ORF Transcript_34665/g.80911 Transcript_34665/m.80911 type:complete len:524 (+) Transcript_34665:122-1693(+)|eukprot:CAMPEP_0178406230 /NCGR_PEP_ID=MMETSP0689_2-20121128/18806_1 /TAXON_ID=160604 /ORGANISM="Amphidinium massartii, Strain CS-259" /LENGTH=523 /DNA_ID=CAMNT_0020027267 /DNA_START=38 /DNA_END=1609 /DNA_ORIENTATION=-
METRAAVKLAQDILLDHFGDVTGQVGAVLLERGPLTFSNIMRFLSQGKRHFTDEIPKFPQVRNALLSMVQHNIVTAKPDEHIKVELGDVVPHIYTIHIREVLSRCRFPHFVELVWHVVSPEASHLLLTIFKHGRVHLSVAVAESLEHPQLKGKTTHQEMLDEIQDLSGQGFVCPVAPFVDDTSLAPPERPDPTAGTAAGTSEDVKTAVGEDGAPDAKRVKLDSEVRSATRHDPVYRVNTGALNFQLCKYMLVRVIEERLGQLAAEVLYILVIRGIAMSEDGRATSHFVPESTLIEVWKQNFHEEGRDPAREQEGLIKALVMLEQDKSGFVRKRVVQSQQRGSMREDKEWVAEWTKASEVLSGVVRSQLLRDRFGEMGLRIFNLLNESTPPQKLEENEIFHVCMVPQTEGREMLNAMVKSHFLNWQEVAKSAAGTVPTLLASYWLYYVDRQQVQETLQQIAFKALLNLRIRYRVECAKTPALDSRRATLSTEETRRLKVLEIREDLLERSFLLLNSVLLGLECV